MLIVGSNNTVTVPAYRLAIRPESGLENLGPDHTPRPRLWPATAIPAAIYSPWHNGTSSEDSLPGHSGLRGEKTTDEHGSRWNRDGE